MGEVASAGASPPLALGAVLLGALVVVGVVVGWWLFGSPIGEPVPPSSPPAGAVRLATLTILLYFVAGTAGIWDTAWHMQFGLFGAVDDFWWPPHLVIYAGFGLTSAAAFLALARVLEAPGGPRARVRAQPLLAAFGLAALFQMLSGPSDEAWHRIYGADLTGWSLPHLLLVGMAGVALPAIAAFYAEAARPRTPAGWLVATLPFVVLLWSWSAVAVGDWEFATRPGSLPPGSPVFARPAWQYVVAGVAAAAPVIGLAAAVLGRRWAATAVAVLTLLWGAAVFLLFALLGSPLPLWTTPLATCAAAVALDARRRRPTGAVAAGAVYAAVHAGVLLAGTLLWTGAVALGPADAAAALALAVPVGALAYAGGHTAGGWLRRVQARSPRVAPAPARLPATAPAGAPR